MLYEEAAKNSLDIPLARAQVPELSAQPVQSRREKLRLRGLAEQHVPISFFQFLIESAVRSAVAVRPGLIRARRGASAAGAGRRPEVAIVQARGVSVSSEKKGAGKEQAGRREQGIGKEAASIHF